VSKIIQNFDKLVKKIEAASIKSMETFEKAVKPQIIESTPKDTGALRDSYEFVNVSSKEGMIEYKFSFGKGLTGEDGQGYAGIVHEWYGKNVKWTTEGTGPGYLATPVLSSRDQLAAIYRVNFKGIRI
jgi:hypothetical protein